MCYCIGTAVSVLILPVSSAVFPVFWRAVVGGGQHLLIGRQQQQQQQQKSQGVRKNVTTGTFSNRFQPLGPKTFLYPAQLKRKPSQRRANRMPRGLCLSLAIVAAGDSPYVQMLIIVSVMLIYMVVQLPA